ncbi:MAG: type I polyketide synthase, partial [Acidimicrobiia bacterium]
MAAEEAGTDIAIVGMAGRFPGAADVDRFWDRVVAGEDCLTDVDEADLLAGKIPASLRFNPDYVRRTGKVDDVDRFDAGFFNIGPRDAAIMDPQHRLFLETAWEALESAGVVPGEFDGAIGVFAGCGMNSYLVHNLLTNPQIFETLGWFLVRHTGNDKDFLATEVSYKLDLRGPSINVQTACSTSLVAVHLAISSLLAFECDVALAGGVTIEAPHATGYLYREGEILAKDGRCRAFDLHSSGTVLTGGVGAVALRRLDDALADGDEVLAVIKGSAVNNDGQRKAGYLAPSVDGHADVVREALSVSGIDARTIGMVEAHGTGTAVGDPIEVAALTAAFRTFTKDSQFCRLVSSKPNIGHLDTAAGVASLIKAVQALRHRTLPPLANHTAPSEMFDITRTPFVLSGEAAPWPEGPHPRRVGISSLGVGGTNAHVIIEEAPPVAAPSEPPTASPRLLVVSARSESSAQRMASALADRLDRASAPGFDGPSLDLDSVASTLLHHRRRFDHRLAVAATDLPSAVGALRAGAQRATSTVTGDHRVGFLLPGGGSQYPAMGAGLASDEVFESTVRDGIVILRKLTGVDLEPALRGQHASDLAAELEAPTWSLPSIFITEVAMARLWMSWGITPAALMGHSLGEYAAAHLAGVMSFEDAIALVHKRADIMERASVGGVGMLVIPLPEDEIVPLLGERLDLAAVNAADEVVVSGPRTAIEELAGHLASRDVQTTMLPLTAAAHSRLLEPYLGEFEALLRSMTLRAPTLPVITNLTGKLATAEQLTDPMHWVTHLRRPVRFSDGLATFATMVQIAVDTGPGQALSSAARRAGHDQLTVIPALRHHKDTTDDVSFTYGALAKAWMAGAEPDWEVVNGPRTSVVQLPTYRFDRERYWIEPGDGLRAPEDDHLVELAPIERWGWSVEWIDAPAATVSARGSVAVLCHPDRIAFGNDLVSALSALSGVSAASLLSWPTVPWSFEGIDVAAADHLVVVLGGSDYDDAEDWALVALSAVMRGLGERGRDVRVSVITPGALPAGGPATHPAFALALGP